MAADEILAAADKARPDLMEKVATSIALLERLSPDHAVELKNELSRICEYTVEKSAAVDLAGFGLGVTGAIAAGVGGAVATDLYDAAKKGLTKGRNYNRIMEAHPDLKQYDKKQLRTTFDSIHRYVPEFTADPTLGGSLMRAGLADPYQLASTIKDLLAARKNLVDAKKAQFPTGHLPSLEREQDLMATEALRLRSALAVEKVRHKHNVALENLKDVNRRTTG